MSNLPLGQIITTPQEKDAIHVAVAPVVARHKLAPGAHAKLFEDGSVGFGAENECIGIIDPFLKAFVERGQRCWLFMYPNTITGLRHDWTHPAFSKAATQQPPSESRVWLEEFARRFGVDVDDLIQSANNGNCEVCGNNDNFNEECRDPEFWKHIEAVTGRTFDGDHRDTVYFHCSC